MSETSEAAKKAVKLAARAKRLFEGKGPDVTGAALCELVALHLACHIVPDNEADTKALRATLLEAFVTTVGALVPVMEATEVLPRLRRQKMN